MSEETKFITASVKKNFVMNVILKMSAFIFPLITFPYISRVLGAGGNGKVAFAASFVYYFTTFAMLGIPTYGIRECAQCRDDKVKLSRTVHELLMLNMVTTVIAYAAFFIAVFSVEKLRNSSTLLLITSTTLILTTMGMEWFYQAIEQYSYITYRNLAFKVISVVLMFLFVKRPEDYLIYAGINVVGAVGSNILNMIRIRKYILIENLGEYHPMRHLKPVIIFFLLTVATTIYTNLDSVMLGFMTTDDQVGYYNAAIKTKEVLLSLVTALGAVLLPRMSYHIRKGEKDEFRRLVEKSFQFVMLMAVPLMFYFIIEAKDAIYFLAGKSYAESVLPMQIITPTILFIGITGITGIQILVPLGKEKYTIISTVWGAVTDLILNALLIPVLGAAGVAIGTLVAELVVLIVQAVYLRGNEYVRIDWKDTGKIAAAGLIATTILLVFKKQIELNSSFLNLVLTAVIYFGVYGIVLCFLKERVIMEDVLERIKHKSIIDR